MITISLVRSSDISRCTEIYNYYIKNTCNTLEEQPIDEAEFSARVKRITASHPFLVARDKTGAPVGYAYLDVFNARSAYRCTASLSIYVDPDRRHEHIGSTLYDEIEQAAGNYGIENIVSLIANDNEASIAFHRRCGFSLSGELDNVAFKLGRSIGIVFMKKRLVPLRITKKGQDDSDSCIKANRKAMRG